MKPAHLAAALAATLVLASCGGGGGGTPTTASDEAQRQRAARTAAARLADNQPEFGSVTQSSNDGTTPGSSGDRASAEFDGTDLTVTVTRQDGSEFTLDSTRPDTVVDPLDSGLTFFDDGGLYDFEDVTPTGLTIGRVAVIWDRSDTSDWLAGGYWLRWTGSESPLRIDRTEIGAFVDGPEIEGDRTSLPGSGTARYEGDASGLYTLRPGSGPDRRELGEWTADAELTANFNTMTIEGCIGCNGGMEIEGTRIDFGTGEDDAFTDETRNTRLRLMPVPIAGTGSFRGPNSVQVEDDDVTIGSSDGSWGGRFSTEDDASGNPRLVAGTVGGRATIDGGGEAVFVGAWYGGRPGP